jgi:inosine-uridine nucleoside N-ribohydrolase
MSPRPVIIDCDPGHDDALAILLALGSPDELDVLAITVVAGNVPLALTEKNARKICELAGRTDLPVHAGLKLSLGEARRKTHFCSGCEGSANTPVRISRCPNQLSVGSRRLQP